LEKDGIISADSLAGKRSARDRDLALRLCGCFKLSASREAFGDPVVDIDFVRQSENSQTARTPAAGFRGRRRKMGRSSWTEIGNDFNHCTLAVRPDGR
jgi:hypothetical protein